MKHPAKEPEIALNFHCKPFWKLWMKDLEGQKWLLKFLYRVESNMTPWICLKMQLIHL